jgi:RNA polymerase sigma factor for flagellar operon FliA
MNAYARTSLADRLRRDQLIADYVDMARRIALRVGRRVPDHVSQDDLVAAAMLGLAEAADRFDAARGEPFVAFAERRVRGAVFDELRRGDILPRRVRQAARKVGKTLRALEHKLGRPPEDEEAAEALGVSVDEYRDDLEKLTHMMVVDVDPDTLFGPDRDDAEKQAVRSQLVERLLAALPLLPERDQLVLSLYHVEELSYADIGQVLGVGESRVCQLHGRAITRLRAELEVDKEVG